MKNLLFLRRLVIILISVLISVNTAYASLWQKLWKTNNQIALDMMKSGQFKDAKNTFTDQNWQAYAAFRAKDYKSAAELYAKSRTLNDYYNQGNSLAFQGKLQDGIDAYNKALQINPNDADVIYNKKTLDDLLKQQKENNSSNNSQSKNQNNNNMKNKDNKNNQQNKQNPTDKDKQQMKNQWLKLIPEDPGGLLREKFKRDHLRRSG
ncbi:MAG: hypothetical protein A3E88_00455 [Legionellales bacterium RIFCSPHIGHO2_12_FULL_35_11]|nr:MAG: hypothetical protein A3E88_00455 [Legionellales bacterium RIFCSPHIGHO2_12_FULL_35_11]